MCFRHHAAQTLRPGVDITQERSNTSSGVDRSHKSRVSYHSWLYARDGQILIPALLASCVVVGLNVVIFVFVLMFIVSLSNKVERTSCILQTQLFEKQGSAFLSVLPKVCVHGLSLGACSMYTVTAVLAHSYSLENHGMHIHILTSEGIPSNTCNSHAISVSSRNFGKGGQNDV